VFAYLGFPVNASVEQPVPAVVLLHGGGGSAFPQWVKIWNNRGYAAIAIDTEGHMPLNYDDTKLELTTFDNPGPARNGEFLDIELPISDQWMYHAINATSTACSLLAGDSRVMKDKIGITGISWGGIIASIAICCDPRFSFAVPVYGCSHLPDSKSYFSRVFQNQKIKLAWDSTPFLQEVKTKCLWLNGGEDWHFSPDATSLCALDMPDASLLIIPGLAHGHQTGWERKEIYSFADSICFGSPELIQIVRQPENAVSHFIVKSADRIVKAELIYSNTGILYDFEQSQCNTVWKSAPAKIDGREISYQLPPDAKAYFINLSDVDNCAVSTQLVQIQL
jgi:dienelactone hydrolase